MSAVAGHPDSGLLIALGVVLGSGNAFLAQRFLATGVPFALTSLFRITALTAVALACGLLLGLHRVYLILGGLGLAQLVLVGVAVRATTRR